MGAIVLPMRRNEAWKYSDVRAALGETALPDADPAFSDRSVIVQLAHAKARLTTEALSPGETGEQVVRLEADGLDVSASDIHVPDGAMLTRIVLQSNTGVTMNHARIRLGKGARYRQFVLAFGSRLTRIETEIHIEGEDAAVDMFGVYLAAKGRHADLTSHIAHKATSGVTQQLVRGAVRAGGRGVFQGKILVAKGAQKTDARQHHDALLLEEGAEVNAKPELEIYADDVSCAHGNTAGALDDKALFYMRARGIPEAAARAMLTAAFLQAAAPDWLPHVLHNEVQERIAAWLETAP